MIEKLNASSYDELLKCEGKYIRELDCVNRQVPGRTDAEYRADNKDTIKEKRLNALGIEVLRFSDEEVLKDMENVIAAIEYYILEYEKSV